MKQPTMAAKRSAWLLAYMRSIHPRGICETLPLPTGGRELAVHMGTVRGLERRGLIYSPVSGLWYLTEKGHREGTKQ